MASLKTIIKLIRPKTLLWFGISTCLAFGAVIQNGVPSISFIYIIITIIFANIGAIIVNDLGDIEVDKKSPEEGKRLRPLVTGEVTKKEAIIYSTIAFSLSLVVSLLYDTRATIFSSIVIGFALSYSLRPTKFCAKPYGSVLFWVVLCFFCYLLMLNVLSSQENNFNELLKYAPGWLFISGIILFMGIAEIIAKDMRDFDNDREGGRNTYVNFAGIEISSRIMIFFSWFGFILWIQALYMSDRFPDSIFAILCFLTGLTWCIQITIAGLNFIKGYNQRLAATLHQNWTYYYAAMQILTFLSFIKT